MSNRFSRKRFTVLVAIVMMIVFAGQRTNVSNASSLNLVMSTATFGIADAGYAESNYPNTATGGQQNYYLGQDFINGQYNKGYTRLYLRFNFGPGSLPAGSVITGAQIYLYQYARSCTSGSNFSYTAYPVTSSWAGNTMTWNNSPSKGNAFENSSFVCTSGWKTFNVTGLAQSWFTGGDNYGVSYWGNPESASGVVFRSHTCNTTQCPGQEHPYLSIEYTTPDTTPPTGAITSPANNVQIGPSALAISADASDNGGSGVGNVYFRALYDGQWHEIGSDNSSPYSLNWTPPAGLHSQQMRLAIRVVDNANNTTNDAGGQVIVNFIESNTNPGVTENWIPESRRAYLNQRSLSPNGDSKCGSASAAMMLAMMGKIGRDYGSMRDTANAIYPNSIKDGQIWLYLITQQMRNRGLNAREVQKSSSDGWATIKSEINAGRPVMVLSRKVTAGHFFVVVGYSESATAQKIIVYDPYGKWLGSYRSYDKNTTSSTSAKGRWVYYDYGASFDGGWMVTIRPTANLANEVIESASELDNPDPISEEPEELFEFDGTDINDAILLFIPVIIR